MSIAPSPLVTSTSESNLTEEKQLRARARRRALFCPGAGWALLGYANRGLAVLAGFVACWAAIVWMVLTLSPASIWSAAIGTLFALVAWIAELFDIGWCRVRPGGDGLLVRRFGLITFASCAALLVPPLLVASHFGMTEVIGDGMWPTIESGERLVFHRHVADRDLKEGTVVLYRVPPRTKAALPGELVVARILAAPDDELSIEREHYLVNGEVSRYRITMVTPVELTVPPKPKTLTVPDNRYFVVQDCQTTGTGNRQRNKQQADKQQLDSRQIGWVRRIDIVSTRLFHFGGSGLLRPVE
ncbi:MAG TPA: signal peptidase I [Pirellulales bacterium]|nr:signal peptidase I [Pirellulales bacterium]